ncbi:sensor histidine kinase [Falsirhodobacter halotolerans]|uniref:sensor histidine kinase n=1 Tax=Falsirhodobacter halotolerans TaxID=1146892 RepID=UPI001FD51BC4|nr:HAMP domain-containing sensor histidine kinase [Falsirhodobacter halotolerans]MCJ8138565.1 HAMP domain-containing histidine kinase [Falsirhodobacter halotolerans]
MYLAGKVQGGRVFKGWSGFLNSLSGRFLMLTVVFVLLAEVMILVPSIARFREDYLQLRLEKAQLASLALLTTENSISPQLEAELLSNAGVYNVVLRRDAVRQLVLSSPIPAPIDRTYDLRSVSHAALIRDAVEEFFDPRAHVIRVIGFPVEQGGDLIEVAMSTGPLRAAMIDYSLRILAISAAITILTAAILFIAVQKLMVVPIRRVVAHMAVYAEAPEDARRMIAPKSGVLEIREAEEALKSMQTQLTGNLRQKERLAQLGGAVAKISHDLRNILTSAQLFADRIGDSVDPIVARSAPKLVNSITRAVSLCETTLAFGKAEEPPPSLTRFSLRLLVEEVLEAELPEDGPIAPVLDIPASMMVRADREQVYRVLSNLIRNARQAIEATGEAGNIEMAGGEADAEWWIRVGDNGPGLPPKAREHLFTAFQGGTRKGGSGLGLAIAAELVRGHGGRLELLHTGETGTEFLIRLPKSDTLTDI